MLFALRQLMRRTRSTLVLRWTIDGFNRRSRPSARTSGSPRNLLGFVDGTANLDAGDAGADGPPRLGGRGRRRAGLDRGRLVPRGARRSGCSWSSGTARRWASRRRLIGRRKANGAPLGGDHETDVPDFAADPKGEVTPLDAHIRLANPRTPATERNLILRRGFSLLPRLRRRRPARPGPGLRDLPAQPRDAASWPSRRASTGEPLEEYIRPEGGGFFFALPGVPEPGGYLGQGLLADP